MRGIFAVLVSGFALLAAGCGGDDEPTGAAKPPDPPVGKPVLPDLTPAPPQDVQTDRVDGKWHIKFTSILVNVGNGDFILRATREVRGTWGTEQDIQHSVSGAKPVPVQAPLAFGGDTHKHWHVVRVASVWLVPLVDGKPASDSRDRIDTKIGFCFYDFSRQLPKGPKEAVYDRESCGDENDTEMGVGLSRGWGDTYAYDLLGQSIEITGLPDGRYRLFASVDENWWFREVTRKNNLTWVDIDLTTESGGARKVEVVATGPLIRPTG